MASSIINKEMTLFEIFISVVKYSRDFSVRTIYICTLGAATVWKDLNHIVPNPIWLKENRASDNKGKFHSSLISRIWIYSQKSISSLDIRVRVQFFWKIGLFLALFKHYSSGSICYSVFFSFSRAASSEVLEKGQKEPKFSKKMPKVH